MKPCEVITHLGKKIVIVDISNISPEEAIQYLPHAHGIIAQFPPKTALILTDGTKARFNIEAVNALKDFVIQNGPYVKASAAVGSEGLREVLFYSIARLANRNIKAFSTRQEALNWLVSQSES